MNNLEISSDSGMLDVNMATTLNASPSVSTFLPEEDTSLCPLLSTTPSPPPPMHFSHPLTSEDCINCDPTGDIIDGDDGRAETSSCSGSSGIGMDVQVAGTTTLFNQNMYQPVGKMSEVIQESETILHANLNIPASKDTPSFVYWNWPLIRRCTFCCFVAIVIAMVAVVVSMMVALPKRCDLKLAWYKGSVFYEIFPLSFQDSNSDSLGDLSGLNSRIDYLKKLGVAGVRLNSIFPSENYPHHLQNVTSLLEIYSNLGTPHNLATVVRSLHDKNMTLILDLPIHPYLSQLDSVDVEFSEEMNSLEDGSLRIARSVQYKNRVLEALRQWTNYDVDGFYIKGLEHFSTDPYLVANIKAWKKLIGSNRVIIISNEALEQLDDVLTQTLLKHVDLVDVFVSITNGSQETAKQIKSVLEGPLRSGDGPYVHWSLGGVSERRISSGLTPNTTLAATLMSLMLPGTPSIFYGDEISLGESHDPFGDHAETKHLHNLPAMAWNTVPQFTRPDTLPWLPNGSSVSFNNFDLIADMIALRELSPSIFQNAVRRHNKIKQNTSVKRNGDLLILERWYPRRNSFVSIMNFSEKTITLDLSHLYYSGEIMVGKLKHQRVFFNKFEIGPIETLIIKLDK